MFVEGRCPGIGGQRRKEQLEKEKTMALTSELMP